jgi:hypothetical protein
MSNYTKSTNFATKDSLPAGNALKRVKGAEIDDEFNAISVAIATKANINNTALTGTPTTPTASAGTTSVQIASTAFVGTAIAAIPVVTSGIVGVKIDGASTNLTGRTLFIDNDAPSSEGANGDIWFEY